MWFEIPRPVVIGHRGARAYAPENTLAAFELAAKQGAQAIELDVKLTADGHVVVIHDATVDRTTNGTGKVSHLPLTALRDLDAGSFFSAQYCGEGIPTLDEVFETIGKRLYLNVELTNYTTPLDGLVPRVVELVKKHRLEERVLFSSFFPRNLRVARRLLPEIPRGLLAWSGWMGAWARSIGWRGDYAALNPYVNDVNSGLVDHLHTAGKQIFAWTVNTEADLRHMGGLGVDGIITDNPALACRFV